MKEFERSPNEFYPPERHMLRIRASKGLTTFVRAAGCIYNFQCDPCDTLGDLRDVCARTFSLNPVQVKLKITSGVVLPLSRDGDYLQDLKNNNVFDAEATEGTMRIFIVLSESIISYMDLPVNASLAEFRQSVIALVSGLALVPFRLWSRGVEIVEKEGETVGRQLIGGHPVFVELDSDLEQQLLPKNVTRDRLELCEAPVLDMSGSLSLWFKDKEEEEKKAIDGLFPQSRLQQLLDRVILLFNKELPFSINIDGRCLAQCDVRSTLQELHIENGAVVRTKRPLQLHIDFEELDTLSLIIPCSCVTVLELRKEAEKKSRVPLQHIRLSMNNFLLSDSLTISECGLLSDDRLLCRKTHRLRFWWKDRVTSLFASPEMELDEVFDFLEEKTNIKKDLLLLTAFPNCDVIFPNNKARTVMEAGLDENSKIFVTQRTTGDDGTSAMKNNPDDISAFPSFMISMASDNDEEDDEDYTDSD